MEKKTKVLISHPSGNANTNAVVRGLYAKGILHRFITSVAVFKNKYYYKYLDKPFIKEILKRTFPTYLDKYMLLYPFKALCNQIFSKMHFYSLVNKENSIFSSYKVCKYIDKKTSKYLIKHLNEIDSVYCYEDVALNTFKKAKEKKVICLYDLPIGYWRYMRNLLKEEIEKNPEWAVTLGGLTDSEKKTKIKDEELRLADVIYVASSFTKKSLNLYPGILSKIIVIPYGFPPINKNRQLLPINNRKIKLLYVGGLSQRKGISYLFKALENLNDKFTLSIIGSGNIENCKILKDNLNKYNYLGTMPHDKVLEIMAQNDIMVFPSLFEGFGLVITESMSQGTPVITTDRTCGPDIITDGDDGWIVDAGSEKSIRDKLLYLYNNQNEIISAGKHAMLTASKRPWKKYEEEITDSINLFRNNNAR